RIVPILAGLGSQQASGEDPGQNTSITRFLDGVRDLVEARPGRVIVVAGADLAHVGPRFGDESALGTEERERLERADRASIERATSLDAAGFWDHVAGDIEERRICGLAPIWSLLRTVSSNVLGRLLHYEQTVDPEDGSIVSHAAVGFYGDGNSAFPWGHDVSSLHELERRHAEVEGARGGRGEHLDLDVMSHRRR